MTQKKKLREMALKFHMIGYELTYAKFEHSGRGFYYKPIRDRDDALNWKYAGTSVQSLNETYEFVKEHYPLRKP